MNGGSKRRVEVAHHLGGADRREIRSLLVPALRAERVPEREQHGRTDKHRPGDRKHHERRLTALPLRVRERPTRARGIIAPHHPLRRVTAQRVWITVTSPRARQPCRV